MLVRPHRFQNRNTQHQGWLVVTRDVPMDSLNVPARRKALGPDEPRAAIPKQVERIDIGPLDSQQVESAIELRGKRRAPNVVRIAVFSEVNGEPKKRPHGKVEVSRPLFRFLQLGDEFGEGHLSRLPGGGVPLIQRSAALQTGHHLIESLDGATGSGRDAVQKLSIVCHKRRGRGAGNVPLLAKGVCGAEKAFPVIHVESYEVFLPHRQAGTLPSARETCRR